MKELLLRIVPGIYPEKVIAVFRPVILILVLKMKVGQWSRPLFMLNGQKMQLLITVLFRILAAQVCGFPQVVKTARLKTPGFLIFQETE